MSLLVLSILCCSNTYFINWINDSLKDKLLEKHTLLAVMSLPIDLFKGIGVITCIMIFKAHIPHDPNNATWFGYWRDDGFKKVRSKVGNGCR